MSRLVGAGGSTTMPGKLISKLDPGAIDRLAARLPAGAAVLSATNGKTTTAAMAAEILRPRIGSRTTLGANLVSGVASALLAANGAELGLFEVDEAALPGIVRRVRPTSSVSRISFATSSTGTAARLVAARWRDAVAGLPEDAVLVVNGDNPQVGDLARTPRARRSRARRSAAGATVAPACGRLEVLVGCRSPFDYATAYVGHLGDYHCPRADSARPPLDVVARAIELHGLERASFDLVAPEGTRRVELALPGLYNVYNAVAAAALARALGASLDEIAAGLGRFSAAFGRFERIPVGDKRLLLLLVKNPAGANEAVRTLVDGGPPRVAVIALNDAIADGRDVSWIWDVDFELLLGGLERLVATGSRPAELALRFKYAGLAEDAIEVEPDLARALDRGLALTPDGGELVVLPTYTAMLELQRIVADRGLRTTVLGARRMTTIRIGHLYPEYLNIYADRGNIAVLARRAAWRGYELDVTELGLDDAIVPGAHDLYYVGGGQDREQLLVAANLAAKAEPLREAVVGGGAALLAVCGGYQLLGRGYRGHQGDEMPGAGVLPLETVAGDRRMIGDVLLESELEPGERRTIAGFENHAGRTLLDPGAERSAASSPASATTAPAATRAAGSAALSARTSTARCCRGTRGSRTGSSHRRSHTAAEASRPSSRRYPTSWRRGRTTSPPSGRARAAVEARAPRARRGTRRRRPAPTG